MSKPAGGKDGMLKVAIVGFRSSRSHLCPFLSSEILLTARAMHAILERLSACRLRVD